MSKSEVEQWREKLSNGVRQGQQRTDDDPEVVFVLNRIRCPLVHVDTSRCATCCATDVEWRVVEGKEAKMMGAGELSRSGEESGTRHGRSTHRLCAGRVEVDQADGEAVEVFWLAEVGTPCERERLLTFHARSEKERADSQ